MQSHQQQHQIPLQFRQQYVHGGASGDQAMRPNYNFEDQSSSQYGSPPRRMYEALNVKPPILSSYNSRSSLVDEQVNSLQRQIVDYQTQLNEQRNEYMKAMTLLESESFERQQLERKAADLANKLGTTRQALAVTQAALGSLQDAQEANGKRQDFREVEMEKLHTEGKLKDSRIMALETRLRTVDEEHAALMAKKDETLNKMQKKLSDALDQAYKAENDSSSLNRDLSVAQQEIYSLRNRLSSMEVEQSENLKKLEKEYRSRIETIQDQLNKVTVTEDTVERSVLKSATLEAKNIELEARVKYLDSVAVKWERECKSKSEEVIKLQENVNNLTQQKMLTTNAVVLELEEKVQRLEARANARADREATLTNDVKRLEAEVNLYKKRLSDMSTPSGNPQLQELEYAKSLLERENTHLKTHQKQLEQELASHKSALREQEVNLRESMMRQLAAKDEQIQNLYSSLQQEKEKLTSHLLVQSTAGSPSKQQGPPPPISTNFSNNFSSHPSMQQQQSQQQYPSSSLPQQSQYNQPQVFNAPSAQYNSQPIAQQQLPMVQQPFQQQSIQQQNPTYGVPPGGNTPQHGNSNNQGGNSSLGTPADASSQQQQSQQMMSPQVNAPNSPKPSMLRPRAVTTMRSGAGDGGGNPQPFRMDNRTTMIARTINSRGGSSRKLRAPLVPENAREELKTMMEEKKKLKKLINKWNADFAAEHGRDAGVEDKSNDPEITQMYQQYHEFNLGIKEREDFLSDNPEY
jgi:myosin heavy subunit